MAECKESSATKSPDLVEKNEPGLENIAGDILAHSDNNDYVYDENSRMYYSVSTGCYYDVESGLLYQPQTQTYYKYNYERQDYEIVSWPVSNNENTVINVCDVVMQQVNNLNINEKEKIYNKIKLKDTPVPIPEEKCDENSNSDVTVSKEQNESYASKDWQLPEGSNMTIADVVKQTINEHNPVSDYIYDETSKTYYNPSTGRVYDARKKLLYDPPSAAYYIYDEDKQTYEFYCQASPVALTEEVCAVTEPDRKDKLKLRKQFWKKKLKKSGFDTNASKTSKWSNSESSEGEFSSPEDGEIFSSDDDDDVDKPKADICIVKAPVKSFTSLPNKCQLDVLDEFPPSIRAIVESAERLKIGSLILITCTGGVLGREKHHPICIPESCVSKIHAEIKYNSDSGEYTIEDLGSQNGTFINEKRLSEAKEKSLPYVLHHGDRLSLGSCKLLLHIHTGSETCDKCEPGQVLADLMLTQKEKHVVLSKEEKELQRRQTVHSIKKKYGLAFSGFETRSSVVYEDRAEVRRQTVGSDNPHEKTEQASLYNHLPKTNKGYQMLEKMGWKEGQTLGNKADSGIPEPITLHPWALGRGSSTLTSRDNSGGVTQRLKTWIKAQERYNRAVGIDSF